MSHEPRASASDAQTAAPFVRGYTIALAVLAVLFVANALSILALRDSPSTSAETVPLLTFVAEFALIVGALVALVVVLRVRASHYARGATAVLSCFLAVYFPLGTGYFLYWLLRVRRRERGALPG